MTDEPTLGEVIRRLDDITRQLVDLTRELKEDRSSAAATFVRQDVYMAQRHADHATTADLHGDIQTIRTDRAKDLDWRRQVLLWGAGLTITTLVSIALAITAVLAGK